MGRRRKRKQRTRKRRKPSKTALRRRARRLRYELREARRLGLSRRVYVKQRNARQRAHQAKLVRMFAEQGSDATLAYMFKIGQLY